MTSDQGIHEQISALVAQEHELRQALAAHEIAPEDEHAQLKKLEEQLDQAWDLLRQRQAKREFGENPDNAETRPASQVENYLN